MIAFFEGVEGCRFPGHRRVVAPGARREERNGEPPGWQSPWDGCGSRYVGSACILTGVFPDCLHTDGWVEPTTRLVYSMAKT